MKPTVVMSRRMPPEVDAAASRMFTVVPPGEADMGFETALDAFPEAKCQNYPTNCGYEPG